MTKNNKKEHVCDLDEDGWCKNLSKIPENRTCPRCKHKGMNFSDHDPAGGLNYVCPKCGAPDRDA